MTPGQPLSTPERFDLLRRRYRVSAQRALADQVLFDALREKARRRKIDEACDQALQRINVMTLNAMCRVDAILGLYGKAYTSHAPAVFVYCYSGSFHDWSKPNTRDPVFLQMARDLCIYGTSVTRINPAALYDEAES